MKRLFFAIFFALFLLPSLVSAQSGEVIRTFQSDITLNSAGTAEITETITYDFGNDQRHGIFRVIPTRYPAEDDKFYQLEFELSSVLRGGNAEPYEVNNLEDGVSVKIGDPNRTISGAHTYTISYSLAPIVLNAADEDIFRFDITGSNWDVPIQNASATVSSEPEPEEAFCYAGTEGARGADCQVNNFTQHIYEFEAADVIKPGQNLTAELSFANDSFSNYAEPQEPGFLDKYPPELLLGGLFGVGLLFTIIGIFISWLKYYWRKKQKLIVPEYEPPRDFKPGELGLLADNVSNNVEFSATLIDLAVRGFVKIEQTKKPGWFSKGKYTLHKLKDFKEGLQPYEQQLLTELFDSEDAIKLEDVSATTMQSAVKDMHKSLKERLVEKGYYKPNNFKFKAVTGVAFVAGFFLFFFMPFIGFIVLFTLSITGALKGGIFMFRRLTAKGYTGWAEIEGFKEFLAMTEKDRVVFHYAPDKNPEKFSEYLPYAIALGVEKQWAKQFEGTEALQNQNWYAASSGRFVAPTALAGDLSKGFNSYVKSSSVSGSSVSSGGSFSGGGFGGGGGGSW